MSAEWELVCEDESSRTEKMKVLSGYIFRSIMWDNDENDRYVPCTTTQSMVFVPNTPIKMKT